MDIAHVEVISLFLTMRKLRLRKLKPCVVDRSHIPADTHLPHTASPWPPFGHWGMHIYSKVHSQKDGHFEETHIGLGARLWAIWEEVQGSRDSWFGTEKAVGHRFQVSASSLPCGLLTPRGGQRRA